ADTASAAENQNGLPRLQLGLAQEMQRGRAAETKGSGLGEIETGGELGRHRLPRDGVFGVGTHLHAGKGKDGVAGAEVGYAFANDFDDTGKFSPENRLAGAIPAQGETPHELHLGREIASAHA